MRSPLHPWRQDQRSRGHPNAIPHQESHTAVSATKPNHVDTRNKVVPPSAARTLGIANTVSSMRFNFFTSSHSIKDKPRFKLGSPN